VKFLLIGLLITSSTMTLAAKKVTRDDVPRECKRRTKTLKHKNQSCHLGLPVRPKTASGNVRTSSKYYYPNTKNRIDKECVIEMDGYTADYSLKVNSSYWVQYELTDFEIMTRAQIDNNETYERPVFTRLEGINKVQTNHYDNTGYARGHLAPKFAFHKDHLRTWESFKTINIAPQIGGPFNSKNWLKLEETVGKWIEAGIDATIITGVIYPKTLKYVTQTEHAKKKGVKIAIPSHFYKIIVDRTACPKTCTTACTKLKTQAFIMKNINYKKAWTNLKGEKRPPLSGRKYADIGQFVTSIDKIESMTGLDFLSRLPDAAEKKIEAKTNKIWPDNNIKIM
jgi:endonuclease G